VACRHPSAHSNRLSGESGGFESIGFSLLKASHGGPPPSFSVFPYSRGHFSDRQARCFPVLTGFAPYHPPHLCWRRGLFPRNDLRFSLDESLQTCCSLPRRPKVRRQTYLLLGSGARFFVLSCSLEVFSLPLSIILSTSTPLLAVLCPI